MKTLSRISTYACAILALSILPTSAQPTNQYVFYGVSSFDSGAWLTITDASRYRYPWSLDNNSLGGPGHGCESYTSANYPGGTVGYSYLYYQLTNDFDQYGDPKPHLLNFWYEFVLANSSDGFQCRLASSVDAPASTFLTNLPWAQTWHRVSLSIPPVPSGTQFPMLIFMVYRAPNSAHYGPQAYLDPSVQWCSIDTPIATPKDFVILPAGPGSVKVAWNTAAYKLGKWQLQSSGAPTGPYTNKAADINIANSTASVVLPAESAQFYRLAHY
jgi:hypothetical protein